MIRSAVEVLKLLVVSRDSAILRPLWLMGESKGWQLEIAADPWEAIDKVQSGAALDLLLLDLPQGSAEGLHSLRWLRRLPSRAADYSNWPSRRQRQKAGVDSHGSARLPHSPC